MHPREVSQNLKFKDHLLSSLKILLLAFKLGTVARKTLAKEISKKILMSAFL